MEDYLKPPGLQLIAAIDGWRFYEAEWMCKSSRGLSTVTKRRIITLLLLLTTLASGCQSLPSALGGSGSESDDCIYVRNSWSMLRLALPVVGSGRQPALITSPKEFASQKCKARHVRAFVQDNEHPVIVDDNVVQMTVEGDICSVIPKFVIYQAPPSQGKRGKEIRPDTWQAQAPAVAGAIAVTMKRCGTQPKEMDFVHRTVPPLPPEISGPAGAGKISHVPFNHTDVFLGRISPRNDFEIQHTLHQRPVETEEARQRRTQRLAEQREFKKTVGGLLALLIVGALLDPPTTVNSQPGRIGEVMLRVCNEGTIPLYVAVVEVPDLTHDHNLSAWYTITPNSTGPLGGCPAFFVGNSSNNFYYLAFAIRKKDGRFGSVRYVPNGSEGMDDIRYCLGRDHVKRTGSLSELTTCRGKEKLTPFTAGVRIYRNGTLDVTLRPHFDEEHEIEVYLERTE